jgi:hypothetical protein
MPRREIALPGFGIGALGHASPGLALHTRPRRDLFSVRRACDLIAVEWTRVQIDRMYGVSLLRECRARGRLGRDARWLVAMSLTPGG